MIKQQKDEFTFYLTTKQKEAVDSKLKGLAGNFNSRRFKYYYVLDLINVNSVYGHCKQVFISSITLKKYFHQTTVIAEIIENLRAWKIIDVTLNYSSNKINGHGRAFIILPAYRGVLNERIRVKADNRNAKFVKKLIDEKNEKIKSYNQLQSDVLMNLYRLTVNAPDELIAGSVSMDIINRQDFNISESKYGRITTAICSVERVNRKYLKLDEKPIIEVDIANSQPLLSLVIFEKYFKSLNQNVPDDLKRMRRQCEAGLFYNEIMDILNIPSTERGDFKKNFFELFFASNNGKKSEVSTIFRELYPNVASALNVIKKGNYKRFAQQLQKIESDIIFSVLKKLYAKDISALTIHDSLVVSSVEDASLVQELLTEEFKLRHQLKPKLKTINHGDEEPRVIKMEPNKQIKYIVHSTQDTLECALAESSLYISNFLKFKNDVANLPLDDKKRLIKALFDGSDGDYYHKMENKTLEFYIQTGTDQSKIALYG